MKQVVINNISTWYYITEDGKLYNDKTNNWLKGQVNIKNGYRYYAIKMPNGDKKKVSAHRMVANAYIPNPNNLPQVNHKDCNKLNNQVENLEWVTHKQNIQHSNDNELRKVEHIFCFTPEKILVAEYKNMRDAAKATNIAVSQIEQCLRQKPTTLSGGFYWSKDKILGETKEYPRTNKSKPVNQYDLNGRYLMTFPSIAAAGRSLGCSSSHIGECCRGRLKTYKGYIWKYVNDIVLSTNESSCSVCDTNK